MAPPIRCELCGGTGGFASFPHTPTCTLAKARGLRPIVNSVVQVLTTCYTQELLHAHRGASAPQIIIVSPQGEQLPGGLPQ